MHSTYFLGFLWLILLLSNCHQPDQGVSKAFILEQNQLPEYEDSVDHRTLVAQLAKWTEDWDMRDRGTTIYRTTCFTCHGDQDQPGSLPTSVKFWRDSFNHGNDPYAMYETLTRGFGLMPPQTHLVPRQKYEVIAFIREELIKPNNAGQYFVVDNDYLEKLPSGSSLGPAPGTYQPWAEMDYGNWLMRCYELADDQDPPKIISTGRAPLPNEDYSQVNFAYKGIALRLDSGPGGVADGNTFVLFDHDLMRVAGAWSGKGFIDWEDILMDGQHNVYPRTVGKRLFANPVQPGWADPNSGSYADPRPTVVDGRRFGPLPRSWAKYKGLYRYGEKTIIEYTIGNSRVLESHEHVNTDSDPSIIRTLNIDRASNDRLQLLIAPDTVTVHIIGDGVTLKKEENLWIAEIDREGKNHFAVLIADDSLSSLAKQLADTFSINDLSHYTKGGPQIYDKMLSTPIISGPDTVAYTVDVLVLPIENPWKSRMRPTGIDFLNGGDDAVVCTIDGEVWKVVGITQKEGQLQWHRIATGMFQPLGIKVLDNEIFVSCRDQIVHLIDLNGDGETDYYESFNSDHQVTEHFHEFAMGLQSDEQGNLYYAKSGRHARTSLVPQHGTLIKVSSDGEKSEIMAKGFRAANGVCINPDGSFYVTDQQGYWNPMNRINRVTNGGFYGNMWGYAAPDDSSDAAMEQPTCWIDMKYDRSPAELLWATSERWGPLSGSLLNLSYGYGKIFVVMPQEITTGEQGGMIELPIPQFPTGVMRGRFNPGDGQLYVCGMSAWATSRMIQVGGLYRVRYTANPSYVPIKMLAGKQGIQLFFSEKITPSSALDIQNYTINTWQLRRTRKYGSDRFDEKKLEITQTTLSPDHKSIFIEIPELSPTWIIEIIYQLTSSTGHPFQGAIQGTIHELHQLNVEL